MKINGIFITLFFILLFNSLLTYGQTLKEQIDNYNIELEFFYKRLDECKDLACYNELLKQIEILSEKVKKLVSQYKEEFGSKLKYSGTVSPKINEILQDEKKAKENLRNKEKDPCYESMLTKELIRQTRGVEPYWLVYIPVLAEVNYNFSAYYQYWWKDKDIISYNSTESLPACLEIFRQENNPNNIISLTLYTKEDADGRSIQIQEIEASLLAGEYPHKTNKLKTIRTNNPQDFIVDTSWANLFMEYHYDPLSNAELPIRTLSLSSALKMPDESRLLEDSFTFLGGNFIDFQINDGMTIEKFGADAFTVSEILNGIKTGSLSIEFPINYSYKTLMPQGQEQFKERFVREGSVKLNLYFNASPGTLVVTPKERFYSSKSGQEDAFDPVSKTFNLTNKGQTPIQYLIEWNSEWLSVSDKKGFIQPNEEKIIRCKVNENARKLKTGIYMDQINFENISNGRGNTSRDVVLEVKEEQVWQIKLTGQFTDDKGGKPLAFIGKPTVTLNFGVRFDFEALTVITIEKKKDKWFYKEGIIKSTDVKLSSNFDSNWFNYKNIKCLNCNDLINLSGSSISGEVIEKNLRLFWPPLSFLAKADWYLKGTHQKDGKKFESTWTHSYFGSSEMFFGIAKDYHIIPLEEGYFPMKPIKLRSYKDQFRLKSGKPISIYYRYFNKRIK